jgi:hypothetical protein
VTFFDKKEDVINIELTPYGRSLLSKGELLPSYYAFFDDDILYDVMAAGETEAEAQNIIQTRILSETPRLRPQRDLQSPEGLISQYEYSQKNTRPHTQLNLNYMTEPLGTSDSTSDFGPSWKSLFLKGEITGSVQTTLTGSDVYLRQIPQIDAVIEYTMQIQNTADDSPVGGQSITPRMVTTIPYPDGTYVNVLEEQVLCHLTEKAGFTLKDGLEMEVYVYEENSKQNLIPLKFRPKQSYIKNGILTENPDYIGYGEDDSSYVDYYLNINFDGEISNSDLCQGIQNLKSQDVELDLDIECRDEEGIDFDIYGTRIVDVEKCD